MTLAMRILHRSLLALSLAATLFACVQAPPPPGGGPDPSEIRSVAVAASEPVVGAELVLRYDASELRFLGLEPQADGLLLRARDDEAGELTVALVGDGAVAGPLLAARFHAFADGDAPTPTLGAARAYRSDRSVAEGALAAGEAGPGPASVRPFEIPSGNCPLGSLEPSYADRPLGELTGDGAIGVLDALAALDLAVGRSAPDGPACYRADLVPALAGPGAGQVGADDVAALLAKVVDPQLPAELHLRPLPETPLAFVPLAEGQPVLVGNLGRQPLGPQVWGAAPDGLRVDAAAVPGHGVPGQSWAYRVDPASFGELHVEAGDDAATYRVGNLAILIAGQSNAQGRGLPLAEAPANAAPERIRMFGNDYRWDDPAQEPLDSATDQFDRISYDPESAASAGVALGNALHAATDRSVYLIPSSQGGTALYRWQPGSSSRETDASGGEAVNLFENAQRRARISARLRANPRTGATDGEGGPVVALYWHQGESDSRSDLDRRDFVAETEKVFDAFGFPLVVYGQLGPHGRKPGAGDQEATEDNLEHQDIAERQRRMEAGSYQGTSALDQTGSGVVAIPPSAAWARPRSVMIVTNDLPMSDHIHLSAEAQAIVGQRIALAVREHLLGENVEGTGPRLERVLYDPTNRWVELELTRPVTASSGPNAYSGFFTVFDGPPTGDIDGDPLGYGSNELGIRTISRVAPDRIRIELAGAPSSGSVYVRYMPPAYRPYDDGGATGVLQDVVRGTDPHGLPLPSFGPLKAE